MVEHLTLPDLNLGGGRRGVSNMVEHLTWPNLNVGGGGGSVEHGRTSNMV